MSELNETNPGPPIIDEDVDGLLKEAQVTDDEQELDSEEASAYFIHVAHEQFRDLAYKLANRKKRSLARVLEAVLFEPLEKIELSGPAEKELFELCQQIMYNKGVVLNYSFKRFQDKVKTEKEGEENNG